MDHILPHIVDNCIFCGGSPTTNEHVFPVWSHRYITKKKGKFSRVVARSDLQDLTQIVGKGKGDIHDWQVKCVCENCNNGWMRDIENAARPFLIPLIQGQSASLNMRATNLIASWAVLKAMVGENGVEGFNSWSEKDLFRMRHLHKPPLKFCAVLLANFQRTDSALHWATYPMTFLRGRHNNHRLGEPTTKYNGAATTQVIGDLFIHTIHAPLRSVFTYRWFEPPTAKKLICIWPPAIGQHVSWPSDPITDGEANRVSGQIFNALEASAKRVLARRARMAARKTEGHV